MGNRRLLEHHLKNIQDIDIEELLFYTKGIKIIYNIIIE